MPKGNLIEISFGKSCDMAESQMDDSGPVVRESSVGNISDRIECKSGLFFKRMRVRMVVWTKGAISIKVSLSAENRKWVERNKDFIVSYLKRVSAISLPDEGRGWSVLPNSRAIIAFPEDSSDIIRFFFFVEEATESGRSSRPAPRVNLHLG